jgi:hypothetical protein
MIKIQNKIGPTTSVTGRFGHLYLGYYGLPFDFAQDREPVERLVEPFRVSYFVLPRPLTVGTSYDFPHHIRLPFQDA